MTDKKQVNCIENVTFYEQACEMWRHNDAQYGQIFVVFAAQSIGAFLIILAQNLDQEEFSVRLVISGILLIMNFIFFAMFVRLRSLLESFQVRILAFEKENNIGTNREFRDTLWPTSYSMIALILIITIVELFVLLF